MSGVPALPGIDSFLFDKSPIGRVRSVWPSRNPPLKLAPAGERLALFVTDIRFSKTKYCATSSLTVQDGTQPTSPVMAVITKSEPRAFLSSEDALSLRICGGVLKFVYMSVPVEGTTLLFFNCFLPLLQVSRCKVDSQIAEGVGNAIYQAGMGPLYETQKQDTVETKHN